VTSKPQAPSGVSSTREAGRVSREAGGPGSFIVAIDGPSGAGKGTVARAVAARLGYRHIDTGAMYRAVAWKALQEQLDLSREDAVADLARRVRIEVADSTTRLDGQDISALIRTAEVDTAAAAVARQPRVREVLIQQQREMGRGGRVVMEGRDIGTVVFPDANVKVYLDASPEERARRRAHDPAHAAGRGAAAVQDVATALEARDFSDRTRAASPLTPAADAVVVDTTGLSIEEAIQRVLALVDLSIRRHER
jgi:CMP/dCMP kinase